MLLPLLSPAAQCQPNSRAEVVAADGLCHQRAGRPWQPHTPSPSPPSQSALCCWLNLGPYCASTHVRARKHTRAHTLTRKQTHHAHMRMQRWLLAAYAAMPGACCGASRELISPLCLHQPCVNWSSLSLCRGVCSSRLPGAMAHSGRHSWTAALMGCPSSRSRVARSRWVGCARAQLGARVFA